MKIRISILMLLAFAFQAQAATVSSTVSSTDAKRVATAWTRSGLVFGTRVNADATNVQSYAVADSLKIHAVQMSDGKTVFVAGDKSIEPVIAFAPSISENGPLLDILKQDIYLRALSTGAITLNSSSASASTQTSASPKTKLTSASSTTSKAIAPADVKRKWSALLGEEETSKPTTRSSTTSASINTATAQNAYTEDEAASLFSDVRVAPLLTTRWSQQTSGGGVCYNYYTTNNYPCGCTATAISQIMRYHSYPNRMPMSAFNKTEMEDGEPVEGYKCIVDGAETRLKPIADPDIPTQGKIYDWANMTTTPSSEEQREATGHLTYDVGVLLESNYSAEGTGADPTMLAKTFKAFGYSSVYVYWDDVSWYTEGGLNLDEVTRQKTILANLDAKLPVMLGIYGYDKYDGRLDLSSWAGHAVVADGYAMYDVVEDGVTNETTYVHVNLGWGGTDDAWYNLPEIDTASAGSTFGHSTGTDFKFLGAVGFNITTDPTVSAENKALLTGRIVDDAEVASANATVSAFDEEGIEVATTTADGNGIYSFWLPANKNYEIEAASADGSLTGAIEKPVTLLGTTASAPLYQVSSSNNVGNLWGVNVEVSTPCVRIGETLFPNLDRALSAAAPNDVIEIVLPAKLRHSFTLDKPVTIVATNANANASPVTCVNGAMITITNNVTATFTNIVFKATETVLNVAAGSAAHIGGVAVFDELCHGVPGIITADRSGLVIVAELLNGLTLECTGATSAGDDCCMFSCGTAAATASAPRIISLDGEDRAGAYSSLIVIGGDVGYLKWVDDAEIVADVALVSLAIDGGTPSYYRSFDKMMRLNSTTNGSAYVTLMRDAASVTNLWTLAPADGGTADWTFYSEKEGGYLDLSNTRKSSFVIGSGASLTCTNIAITTSALWDLIKTPFTIGSNATLTLDCGASIRDLPVSSNTVDIQPHGTFNMKMGSSILNCKSSNYPQVNGTVQINFDAVFNFDGGAISGCRVSGVGGAIYIYGGGTLNISGEASAIDNVAGSDGSESRGNVHLDSANSVIKITDRIFNSTGIGISGSNTAEGDVFAKFADGISDAHKSQACAFFSRDNVDGSELYATYEGSSVFWSRELPPPVPTEDSTEAEAKVAGPDGDAKMYVSLREAFRAATNENSTVTLLRDNATWRETIRVIALGTILDGSGFTLYRPTLSTAKFAVTNASLTLKNITIDGGFGEGGVIDVYNGIVTLNDGTEICNVNNNNWRDLHFVAPIAIQGGEFNMNSGASIHDCFNGYEHVNGGALSAGAVVVSSSAETNATANIRGGVIENCSGTFAGGIYIGNDSTINISGNCVITNNDQCVYNSTDRTYTRAGLCNVVVHDLSILNLDGELTGGIGYTLGSGAETNVFGTTTLTGDTAAASAANFINDANRATGLVDADGVTLVWGEPPPVSDDDGSGGGSGGGTDPIVVSPDPVAFKSIKKTDDGWELVITNRVQYCSYRLIYTDNLSAGWTTTGAWEKAVSDDLEWKTNIVTTAPSIFWKIEAKEGTNTVVSADL